jgi:hypothetical protein
MKRILCLMGSDQMYALTAASVESAGWSVYKTLENPDMYYQRKRTVQPSSFCAFIGLKRV